MIVHQAYRYELDPTREQLTLLAKSAGARRFTWNWALSRRIKLYEEHKDSDDPKLKYTNAFDQHKELNVLKKTEFPWMYEVSKCAPQEALRDLDKAYQNFYRRLKAGDKPGFPRFKKRGVNDGFRLAGAIRVLPRGVVLPKLGRIRIKESTSEFNGRILSATVRRVADRWFVSLAVERSRQTPAPVFGSVAGIDLGLTTFAAISTPDGVEVEKVLAPKPLKAKLKLLARRQRQHARKVKGSNNRRKSAAGLARLHWRIANVRNDFLHKLTTRLAKTKSVIVVEDLCVKGMQRNTSLARSVSDVGFAEFRRQLVYKTTWYGSRLVVADRFFPSSKLCSSCGTKKDSLSLSEREWVCVACGAVHDRDVNAAKNLACYAGATDSSSGNHAHGEAPAGPLSASADSGRRPRRSGKRPVEEIRCVG